MFTRILLPVDPSEPEMTRKAIEEAVALADPNVGELRLVYPKRSSLAGTTDGSGRKMLRGTRPRATRLAGLIPILPHRVAARARATPTTDRRVNRRREERKGMTTKGPLQHVPKKCEAVFWK